MNYHGSYQNKDWLIQKHIKEKLSLASMARECGHISYQAIQAWMKKHAIPIRHRQYSLHEEIFNSCDSPEKAYWIGFLMADGSIVNQDNRYRRLGLLLAQKDKEHLEKFCSFLNWNGPIQKRIINTFGKQYSEVKVQVSSKQLVNDLIQYGIIPRKTGQEQIKNIPFRFLRDFIRGYFDGDGSIMRDRHKKKFVIVSASQKILKQIQGILMKNCQLPQTKIYRKRNSLTKQPSNCYALQYGGVYNIQRIADYLYRGATVYLSRKREIF
jgi:DNA-binding transcriptional regulator WhiA